MAEGRRLLEDHHLELRVAAFELRVVRSVRRSCGGVESGGRVEEERRARSGGGEMEEREGGGEWAEER